VISFLSVFAWFINCVSSSASSDNPIRILHLSTPNGDEGEVQYEGAVGDEGEVQYEGAVGDEGEGAAGDEGEGAAEGKGSREGTATAATGLLFTIPHSFGSRYEVVHAHVIARCIAAHARLNARAAAAAVAVSGDKAYMANLGSIECVVINAPRASAVAESLIENGLRYVVAWETEMEPEAALKFIHAFYAALREQPMHYEHAFKKAVRSLEDTGHYAIVDPNDADLVNCRTWALHTDPSLYATGVPRLFKG
jgi:hypothetical protein